ncbi:MAG: hypothetical protein CVU07_02625 [Bacteroidetes bacterium HGW-Bacteroidetes-23]|nr:MAG: hypothetical protein CVU07_02625 [Bacteroidetes bacterium HGW-Bacteroidetes-23]
MTNLSIIKCKACGSFNRNLDYCSNCGELINPALIREENIDKRKKKHLEQLKKEQVEAENSFLNKLRNHRFWLFRAFGTILHSVWVILLAVGSFLAWLAATISA